MHWTVERIGSSIPEAVTVRIEKCVVHMEELDRELEVLLAPAGRITRLPREPHHSEDDIPLEIELREPLSLKKRTLSHYERVNQTIIAIKEGKHQELLGTPFKVWMARGQTLENGLGTIRLDLRLQQVYGAKIPITLDDGRKQLKDFALRINAPWVIIPNST